MKRRSILGGIAGAIVGGPRAARAQVQRAGTGLSAALNMPMTAMMDGPDPVQTPPVLRLLYDEQQAAERDFHRSQVYRVNGLEPDIAVLLSISVAAKVRMQIARDDARMGIMDRIRQKIRDFHNNPLRAVLG